MPNKAGVQCTTLALVAALIGRDALGAPADPKARAGELFEQGVRQFSSAQYESAAAAFLEADELVPNSRALINGITAARRAGAHLLVARAAQRALARSDLDAASLSLAREALAESSRNLTAVDVSCAPSPCTVTVDGKTTGLGAGYLLPGTHDFEARGEGGTTASEHLSTVAGASYRVALALQPPSPPPEVPAVTRVPTEPQRAEHAAPAPPHHDEGNPQSTKPLTPGFFYAGVGATAVLAGLTVWSGVDTLSAKSDFQRSTDGDWGHVKGLALRTDILLSSALVFGAASAAAGLWLVNWDGGRSTLALLPGGAAVTAAGHF